MITYQDDGMYSINVFEDGYRVGSILSFEGKIWWYQPRNGLPSSENFDSVWGAKRYVEQQKD